MKEKKEIKERMSWIRWPHTHTISSARRGAKQFFFKIIYDTYFLNLLTEVDCTILSVLSKTKSRFEFSEKAVEFWTSKYKSIIGKHNMPLLKIPSKYVGVSSCST